MMEASEANESSPKAWILACLFICVFHRMMAGTMTRAMSVKMVETVAVWAMMRKVSAEAQCPSPLKRSVGVPVNRLSVSLSRYKGWVLFAYTKSAQVGSKPVFR